MIRGVAAHGVDVRALCADDRRIPSPDPPADLDVEVVYLDQPSRMRGRWQRLIEPHGDLAHGPFAERLHTLARGADVVHFNRIEAGSLLPIVSKPAVAQLDCFTRADRDLHGPWTNEGRIAIELLRAERRTYRRARWLLANSDEVAASLAQTARHAEVAVAPSALDPAYYTPRAPLAEPTAGLIGHATWPPTAGAVSLLLASVWPRVLERRPDARLLLAGRGMERAAFPHLPSPPGVEWMDQWTLPPASCAGWASSSTRRRAAAAQK